MSFTYDSDLLADRDKIRFMIDDTDKAAAQFSDEEIAGLLTIYGTPQMAAAAMADRLSARYGARPDISIDGASFGYKERAIFYRNLARTLRSASSGAAGALGTPFVGGVSKAEIDASETDTDRAANDYFTNRPFDREGEPS